MQMHCYSCLCCWSYYFSLLLLTVSFVGSSITIEHRCENDLLNLQCRNSTEKLQIIRSMYGRTSQRLCQAEISPRKTCANIEQSKRQLKERCHGKSSCQLRLNNQIFTDPCESNIRKHFEIHYRCVNPHELCPSLIENCSKTQDLSCLSQIAEDFFCTCPSNICQLNSLNEPIGFHPLSCPAENFRGIQWSSTPVTKGQSVSCPSPCTTGHITRLCQENQQWSQPDYSLCQCPMKSSSIDFDFQCSLGWLMRRMTNDRCLLMFFDLIEETDPSQCLVQAFQSMSWSFCSSSTIDLQWRNLLLHINVRDEPQMFIENRTASSIRLIQQKNSSLMENVTLVFQHSSTNLFRCEDTQSSIKCELICQNHSHVICQCPSVSSSMEFVLVENDDDDEERGSEPGRCQDAEHVAKKILTYLDRLIEDEDEDEEYSIFWFNEQFDSLTAQLIEKIKRFSSIHSHIEYFLNYSQLKSSDQTIEIEIERKEFPSTVAIYSLRNQSSIISPIVRWKSFSNETKNRIYIDFRHENHRSLRCASNVDQKWITTRCQLVSSNFTHSKCSCEQSGTFALMNVELDSAERKFHWESIVSIVCLIISLIRSAISIRDDEFFIRKLSNLNFFLCSIGVQCFFFIGFHPISSLVIRRSISLLLHYFLLTSFSWIFVESLELMINLKYPLKIDRIRLWAYGIYAYAFPLLIVILCLVLSRNSSEDDVFRWIFAIPNLLLMISNIIFFISSFFILSSSTNHLKSSLRCLCLFALIMSTIWFNNLFIFVKTSPILTTISSLQGLFILIFDFVSSFFIENHRTNEKSSQHDNSTQSDYSSAPSSTQPPEYLSSFPHHLSTFRSSTTLRLTDDDQQQQSTHDFHQYYEIR